MTTESDLSFLSGNELAALELRRMYEQSGYRKYRMNQFEEYDLYHENKSFLKSKQFISFNDMDGRMLALKPDVTLSIAKNTRATAERPERFYYVENVFRVDETSGMFKEISQLGLEYIGRPDPAASADVVRLAAKTLSRISDGFCLQVSHIGFVSALLRSLGVDAGRRRQLVECIQRKNLSDLTRLFQAFGIAGEDARRVAGLAAIGGPFPEGIDAARAICCAPEMDAALDELEALYAALRATGDAANLALDFSLISDIDYYSGITLRGYAPGARRAVLAGGDYSQLLSRFGKQLSAVGFAVYLSELSPADAREAEGGADGDWLTVALPKGRLGDAVYAMFEKIGCECAQIKEDNRKLVFENPDRRVRYLLVKPSDVAIYVEHGAADVGVVGKDILIDAKSDVYELLDLGIGKCRLCVAAQNGFVENRDRPLRVATKFGAAAKDYYAGLNREIELIRLNGSIELAPILGLSDVIVDIVESGKTLEENDLSVLTTITDISARLIAHKPSYQFKRERVDAIARALSEVSLA